VFAVDPSRRADRLWGVAEGHLLEFDRICRDAGVPWILLIIPSEVQVDATVRNEVLSRLDLDPGAYDFDGPQRRLNAFAEEHGIAVLDPLPTLRALHEDDDRLYIPNNTHWNERGNRIVGEMLADLIARTVLQERAHPE
jgi:hypothetical protein